MADKIHNKRQHKSWPHFDSIYLSSEAYAEGYDRIFGGKKAENEKKHETRRGRSVQKASRKAASQGRSQSKSTGRVHRSKKVRSEEIR